MSARPSAAQQVAAMTAIYGRRQPADIGALADAAAGIADQLEALRTRTRPASAAELKQLATAAEALRRSFAEAAGAGG